MMERIFSARTLLHNGTQRLQRGLLHFTATTCQRIVSLGRGLTENTRHSFFSTRSEFMWMTCTVLRIELAGTACKRAVGARHRTALLRSTERALKPLMGDASSTTSHTSSRCKMRANSVRCGNVLGCCLHCYAMT